MSAFVLMCMKIMSPTHTPHPPSQMQDAIGGKLTYKGRLCVDNCDIIDLQDGVGKERPLMKKYHTPICTHPRKGYLVTMIVTLPYFPPFLLQWFMEAQQSSMPGR